MNGGRMDIKQRSSRRRWENLPGRLVRRLTQCRSTGGKRESRGKISRGGAGTARECAIATPGHFTGRRLVFSLDPRGADGACVWFGTQPDHGRGNVAEVWIVSGIQSDRGIVADVS